MVTGTCPATASRGEGVTVKLSAESSPSLLQELSATVAASAAVRKNLLFI
ncbi:MAG: hypothetical protein IIW61_04905 [Bacteroidaceae bacterium]|nr:hypothetical protein [Bacteroidaceae bacterium]